MRELGIGGELVLKDDLNVGDVLLVDAFPKHLFGFLL